MSKGLNNPALALTAAEFAKSETGKNTIKATTDAFKILLIVGGSIFAGRLAYKQYKKWRAERYANDNAGNPNLIAAAIIFKSFKRFEFPGPLGFLLGSFDYSTDEDALNDIAIKVTDIKAVSDAYRILFDRNLFFDTQKGLDTEELKTFWNKINAPNTNTDNTTNYPLGTKLHCASKSAILVNQAEKDANGHWKGTNMRYGQFNHGDLVGEVIAYGKVNEPGNPLNGQTYYIVKKVFNPWFPDEGECVTNCFTGVVVQSQVQPKK